MKQINIKGLPNIHLESVGRQIQTSKEKIGFSDEETNDLAFVYDPFYTELQAVIKAEKFQVIYNEKAELNLQRAHHYTAIKALAKAFSYADDIDTSALANALLNIFKKHDKVKKGGSYEMQSAKIAAVIGEIEDGFTKENLDQIAFTLLYEELKQKHNAFEEFMVKHNIEVIKKLEKPTIVELKAGYLESLDNFINSLSIINMKTPSDNYVKLMNAIENIVNKAHLDAKAKRSKSNKDILESDSDVSVIDPPLAVDLRPEQNLEVETEPNIEPEPELNSETEILIPESSEVDPI